MSHLKCSQHERRVLVLDGKPLHREDGSHCETRSVISGAAFYPIYSGHFTSKAHPAVRS